MVSITGVDLTNISLDLIGDDEYVQRFIGFFNVEEDSDIETVHDAVHALGGLVEPEPEISYIGQHPKNRVVDVYQLKFSIRGDE